MKKSKEVALMVTEKIVRSLWKDFLYVEALDFVKETSNPFDDAALAKVNEFVMALIDRISEKVASDPDLAN